jgi:hypothetical protein
MSKIPSCINRQFQTSVGLPIRDDAMDLKASAARILVVLKEQ